MVTRSDPILPATRHFEAYPSNWQVILAMTKDNTATSKYREYMAEIKHRIDVINRAISSLNDHSSLTGYRESDIELIYLQLRHCLELMMFASLSAHYAYGHDLSKRIVEKQYNATSLLKFLKSKNPHFYPSPVEAYDTKDSNGVLQTIPVTDGFLTQDEFRNLYDKACGKLLHAQRKSKFEDGHEKLIEDAVYYRDRLMRLLNCHWITLSEDISLRVIMINSNTGGVGINVMKRIN